MNHEPSCLVKNPILMLVVVLNWGLDTFQNQHPNLLQGPKKVNIGGPLWNQKLKNQQRIQ